MKRAEYEGMLSRLKDARKEKRRAEQIHDFVAAAFKTSSWDTALESQITKHKEKYPEFAAMYDMLKMDRPSELHPPSKDPRDGYTRWFYVGATKIDYDPLKCTHSAAVDGNHYLLFWNESEFAAASSKDVLVPLGPFLRHLKVVGFQRHVEEEYEILLGD